MPDPIPTYAKAQIEGAERFQCLIPDASKPDGVCGWYSAPLERGDALEGLTQHMQLLHNGELVEGTSPTPAAPASASESAATEPAPASAARRTSTASTKSPAEGTPA
jgi:hypothetical protein